MQISSPHRTMIAQITQYCERNMYKGLTLLMAAGFILGLWQNLDTGNGVGIDVAMVFGLYAGIGALLWANDLTDDAP